MSVSLDPEEFTSLVSEVRLYAYFLLAATTAMLYDVCLMLPDEIVFVWRRKWSLLTTLYLIIRYFTLFNMVMQLALEIVPFKSVYVCKIVTYLAFGLDALSMIAVAVFGTVRVWGITGKRYLPALLVFVPSIFVPAINIYGYTIPESWSIIFGGPVAGCYAEGAGPSFH
ncbi:hypothetical protein K474DRAFT_1417870 [Panus rudis PR-1116 ss-1]|nr:hypothetical protein K474DRAFT_1417870 [Panus rudis PR-1116 ss-1]